MSRSIGKSRVKPVVNESIGLMNDIGDMNCFLNTAIQALWVIEDFRSALLKFQCSMEHLTSCLLCSLQSIFRRMSYELLHAGRPVDITELRVNFSDLFSHTGEFYIGSCADSMEAMVTLLSAVHCVSLGDETQGIQSTHYSEKCQSCPAHRAINLQVTETIVCDCRASGSFEWDVCNFFHPFYVAEVLEEAKETDSLKLLELKSLMEQIEHCSILKIEGKMPEILRRQWEDVTLNICPDDNCERKNSRKVMELKSESEHFLVNLVWENKYPSALEIAQLASTIPLSFSIDKVYEGSFSNNYTLKGIIVYGARHYVFFVKNSKNAWFKVDDDQSKKISDGKWIEVIKEMATSRFYPTGLIYKKTERAECFEASLEDWIQLEMSLAKAPEISTENLRRSLLVPSEDDVWECICGCANLSDHRICFNGKCKKPGTNGWICPVCTFLNKNSTLLCKGCGELNKSDHWECDFCNELNTSVSLCSRCSNWKGEKPDWYCPNCNAGNPNFKTLCWKCKNSSNKCKKCNKNKATASSIFCNQCIMVSPADLNSWRCDSCTRYNRDNSDCCSFCHKYKFSKKIDKKSDICAICNEYFKTNDAKYCSSCRTLTQNWSCRACHVPVPDDRKVCPRCIHKLVKCHNCYKHNLPNNSKCYNCYHNLLVLQSPPKTRKTRNISSPDKSVKTKIPTKCTHCFKALGDTDKNNCSVCGNKNIGRSCIRCGRIKKHYICNNCFKTLWICERGHSQLKSKSRCNQCGFTNKFIQDRPVR